ncbi:MAG: hypothetical protein HQM08_27960 [Candidatus Riflebacteria bacterium]|nr:hypothetical protein [Candidatus Riflebacteria bacterium]
MIKELEIIEGLCSQFVADRLSAANLALAATPSKTLLASLESALKVETNFEILQVLPQAVRTIKKRLNGNQNSKIPSILENFLDFFKSFSSEHRMDLLNDLPENFRKDVAEKSFELFQQESEPLIKARILQIFGINWTSSELSGILPGLSSESLSLRMATIELLAQKAPRLILRDLPKYLIAEEPRIRLLAIRGLSLVDMDEAMVHFGVLLEAETTEVRLLALKSSFFFPFDCIKPLMLKFLITETELPLLERAGLVFAINPDLEVPYRLWEIAEKSDTDKRKILLTILKAACKVIFDSGIIKEDFETFSLRLKNWMNQRQATQLVQICVQKLLCSNDSITEVEDLIRNSIDRPFVRESLDRIISTITSEEAKKKISEIVSKFSQSLLLSDGKAIQPVFEAKNFNSLSTGEKISALALISQKDLPQVKPFCDEIASDLKSPFELRSAVFRLALRYQITDYCHFAFEALKRSSEPGLICSTLEYLGAFRADDLFPFLGRYLNHSNFRVRSSALKILKKYDLPQAISVFRVMLLSKEKEQIEAALACVFNFEFCFVRDTIFEFLCSTQDRNFIFAGLTLYESNPDIEGLYDLFRLGEILDPDCRKMVESIRKQTEQILVDLEIIKKEEMAKRFVDFSQRWEKDRNKINAQLADYSAIKLGVISNSKADEQEFPSFFTEMINNRWFLPMLVFLVGIIPLLFILPRQLGNKQSVNISNNLSQLQTISGRVWKADHQTVWLKDSQDTVFILSPAPQQTFNIPSSFRLTVEILPYRYDPDGKVFARTNKILLIEP